MQSPFDRVQSGTGRKMILALGLFVSACAGMLAAGTAAAAGGDLAEARTRYQEDRAACMSGQSTQDRATCLREAGAALQEAKRGRLGDNESVFESNRLARCDLVAAEDHEDCLRRMRGEGIASGSVEGGGVYRELRTIVPGE